MPWPSLYRPNLTPWRYVWGLATAYQRYPWIYDSADFASIEDDEAWEKIRRDAVFAAAIENRRKLVASLDWQVEAASDRPADKRAAQIVEDLLDQVRHFYDARFNLTESIFRGSSWAFIRGRRRPLAVTDDQERVWWVPEYLEHLDRWRFRIVRTDDGVAPERERIRTRWECFSPARHAWEPLKYPHWFVRHYYEETESGLGYGRGLLNSLFFYFRAKEIVLTQGLAGVERWAQGLVTAKVDSLRAASISKDNVEVRDEWIDQLNKHKSEHVLVFGSDDEVQVHWPSGTGHEMVMRFVEYLDSGALRVIQASDLTTGTSGTGGGSFALAQEQGEQKAAYYATDRVQLAEDLDYSLAGLVWNLNHDTIQRLIAEEGLEGAPARRPKYTLRHEEKHDPVKYSQIITQARQTGIPLVKSDVYEKLGLKQPTQDDEVMEGQPAAGGMPGAAMPGAFADERAAVGSGAEAFQAGWRAAVKHYCAAAGPQEG